jgi:hypothetical protein
METEITNAETDATVVDLIEIRVARLEAAVEAIERRLGIRPALRLVEPGSRG